MLTDLGHRLWIDAAELPNEEVIFGSSDAMRQVRRGIEWALREDLPVLIQGESGTGKELVAKYLHLHSNRACRAFTRLNCAALTESLLDVAISGRDEIGTLFLDEISDMEWQLRNKLMCSISRRCLGTARQPGGISVVCSNRIYPGSVDSARFVPPSFWSGNVVRLHLPALRNRKQDIPQLCSFLMQQQARRFGKALGKLTTDTLERLKRWQWPGNLRELENWVARVVILGDQEVLAEELGKPIALGGPALGLSRLSGAVTSKVRHPYGCHRRGVPELRISYRSHLFRQRVGDTLKRRKGH